MGLPEIISQPSDQFIILHPTAFYGMTMHLSIWLSSVLNFQFRKLHYCDGDETQESGFSIIYLEWPGVLVNKSLEKFDHYLITLEIKKDVRSGMEIHNFT